MLDPVHQAWLAAGKPIPYGDWLEAAAKRRFGSKTTPTTKTRKGSTKMGQKKLAKAAVAAAQVADTTRTTPNISPSAAVAAVGHALARMQKEAADADAAGEGWRAREVRREAAVLKMSVAEQSRSKNPGAVARAMRGLGVPLISNRRALPDDRDVKGI